MSNGPTGSGRLVSSSSSFYTSATLTGLGGVASHPIGTAAMMSRELGGVVDSRLKVYGTGNVRVCDASVIPLQVSGHLMSTVYAVAEKGSDLIKEDLQT